MRQQQDQGDHRLAGEKGEEEEEDSNILTVCNAVRQLLYDCGNELGWCFTEDQVGFLHV